MIETEQVVPNLSFSCKSFIKSRSDWHGISTNLYNADWPHTYCLPGSVSAPNVCIVDIIDRCIPLRNLKFRLKAKAWFSDECRKSFFVPTTTYLGIITHISILLRWV